MVREVDPEGFLPEFVREYREIKEILHAEKPEIQLLADAAEQARDCAFILYCGEYEIGRFERMMGVFPAAGDTPEERQARILIRWNEAPPYTPASLKEKLAAICGEGSYSVDIHYDEYRLELAVTLTRAGQVDELERLLQRIVPVNMVISVRNVMTAEPSAELFTGGTVSACAFCVIGD
ncbi:MAG: YmfQ family protein [Oscillospiraceae bacterium]|nr:YmfQ family protein [Oscillospiraceae bacterium]